MRISVSSVGRRFSNAPKKAQGATSVGNARLGSSFYLVDARESYTALKPRL
jgi:hypothetical protein